MTKPFSAYPLTCTCMSAPRLVRARRGVAMPLVVCVMIAILGGCGGDVSSSGPSATEHALQGGAQAHEASIASAASPLATLQAGEGAAGETSPAGSPGANATDGTHLRDTERSKGAPPPRTERQLGEMTDPSPTGFRLGGITVVIDSNTRIEPVTALTEGEPVDVTGYYAADRRTLRATVVRSTRPAAEPATPGAAESASGA